MVDHPIGTHVYHAPRTAADEMGFKPLDPLAVWMGGSRRPMVKKSGIAESKS